MTTNGLQPLMHPAHVQGKLSELTTINYETHYGFKPGSFAIQRDKESQTKLVAFLARWGLCYVKWVAVTYNGGSHTRRPARFYVNNNKPHVEVDRYVGYICDGVRLGPNGEKLPLSNKELISLLDKPPISFKEIKRIVNDELKQLTPRPADLPVLPPGAINPPTAPAPAPTQPDKAKDSPLNGFTTDERKVKALLDSLRPHEPFNAEFFGRTIRAQIHASCSTKSVSFVMHQMIKKGWIMTDNGNTEQMVVVSDNGAPAPAPAVSAPKPQGMIEKLAEMQRRLEQLPELEARLEDLAAQVRDKEQQAAKIAEQVAELTAQRGGVSAEIAKIVNLKEAWAFVEEQL